MVAGTSTFQVAEFDEDASVLLDWWLAEAGSGLVPREVATGRACLG